MHTGREERQASFWTHSSEFFIFLQHLHIHFIFLGSVVFSFGLLGIMGRWFLTNDNFNAIMSIDYDELVFVPEMLRATVKVKLFKRGEKVGKGIGRPRVSLLALADSIVIRIHVFEVFDYLNCVMVLFLSSCEYLYLFS